jgi:thioredoxin-related protein
MHNHLKGIKMIRLMLLAMLISATLTTWATLPLGIDWKTESVEKAIKEASKDHKPIFLYWGAVWCPPCNQIKKTVFETREFKKIIKKYIAVYLDGDTNEAQLWADKLKTKGYPTMLIMSENGQELFRLPTGITPKEYIELLTRLSDELQNIKEIVKKPIEKLSPIEWSVLGAHSWSQDDTTLEDKKSFFQNYFEKIPDGHSISKSRLFFNFMEQIIENSKTLNEKEKYQNYFKELIKDDQLIQNNINFISSYSKQITELLLSNEEIQKLLPDFYDRLWKITEIKLITPDDRLSIFVPIVDIEKLLHGHLSDKTKRKITEIALKASKEAKGDFERQALVDRAISLLIKIENLNDAKKISLKELKISKTPFYFMSNLAMIAKEEKKGLEAVNWSYKAWQISSGKNTRFRWGVSYLSYLLEFEPKNFKRINQDSNLILTEALSDSEAFMGANKLRFSKIKNKIDSWKKDQEADFIKLKTNLKGICDKAINQSECQKWIENL